MDRQDFESSMIASIGYDPSTSILEIEFKKNGAVWQYYDFQESTYYDFIGGGSIGKYFLTHIRGHYTEIRVG